MKFAILDIKMALETAGNQFKSISRQIESNLQNCRVNFNSTNDNKNDNLLVNKLMKFIILDIKMAPETTRNEFKSMKKR